MGRKKMAVRRRAKKKRQIKRWFSPGFYDKSKVVGVVTQTASHSTLLFIPYLLLVNLSFDLRAVCRLKISFTIF